jgi:hypothetical protein
MESSEIRLVRRVCSAGLKLSVLTGRIPRCTALPHLRSALPIQAFKEQRLHWTSKIDQALNN